MLYNDLKLADNNIIESQDVIVSNTSNQQPFEVLELRSINYRYTKSSPLVLKDVSIKIKLGDSIGIIGTSGSGKTTLLDVILGLLEPQDGEIIFNGKKVSSDILIGWRSQCAYLPQEVFLIDNSIRRNVALGIKDVDINEKHVLEALRSAQLLEFLEQLPEGLDTILGEHGVRLSGGQRQRVALARAFYHQRNILVLDEATSALDNETEQEIVEEIKYFKGEKTIIVIAHRLTTVHHCDRIFRLENGRIIEEGTYEEIIKPQQNIVNV
jgi:ABC-type bacteriocin/lantibiotic exporter with double-glycine peptidase domain